MPADLLGDIRAQYAGCVAGERRLQLVAERYGAGTVQVAMTEVLDHSERLMRTAIAMLRPGTYTFEDACDDDGVSDERLTIKVSVTVASDTLMVDFTGSAAQVPTYMNAPPAVTASATYYAAKSFVAPDDPPASGAYRAIGIVAPAGTIVNPTPPAPVAAGNHETAARIFDTVLGALAQADPRRAVAAGSGTSCGFHLTGLGRDPNGEAVAPRTWIEIHAGGRGAGADYDGANALPVFGNTSNTPVEHIESKYAAQVERLEIVPDSGGAGRWRGGMAVRRDVRPLADRSYLTVLSERGRVAPYGLQGGTTGLTARAYLSGVQLGDHQRYMDDEQSPSRASDGPEGAVRIRTKLDAIVVDRGARLRLQSAGGGGFGDPLERDAELVCQDVLDGYVSLDAARQTYGVVLLPAQDYAATGELQVDVEETARVRAARARVL